MRIQDEWIKISIFYRDWVCIDNGLLHNIYALLLYTYIEIKEANFLNRGWEYYDL